MLHHIHFLKLFHYKWKCTFYSQSNPLTFSAIKHLGLLFSKNSAHFKNNFPRSSFTLTAWILCYYRKTIGWRESLKYQNPNSSDFTSNISIVWFYSKVFLKILQALSSISFAYTISILFVLYF